MVNYSKMEEVPRAYGPLEPIGEAPVGRRAPRRRVPYSVRNLALGVAAMGVLGAGLGVYFRPDTGEAPAPARGGPAETPSEPADDPGIEIMVAETGPGPLDATPVEAMAIDVSAVIAAAPPQPSAPYAAPAVAPYVEPAPVARERPMAYARRTIERMLPSRAEAPERAPARAAAPAPAARPAPVGRPVRVEPAPAAPLRVESPARPAAAPAPVAIARVDPPRVAAPAPARPTPSFDCGGARGAAQRMVCEDPRLAALDRRLQVEFERAVGAGHDRNALHLEQDHWLARREAAAPDPVAVADAYQRRIRQLQSMQ